MSSAISKVWQLKRQKKSISTCFMLMNPRTFLACLQTTNNKMVLHTTSLIRTGVNSFLMGLIFKPLTEYLSNLQTSGRQAHAELLLPQNPSACKPRHLIHISNQISASILRMCLTFHSSKQSTNDTVMAAYVTGLSNTCSSFSANTK